MITKLTSIPKHYRQLKHDEMYRPGDWYTDGGYVTLQKCKSAGFISSWPQYRFFRRKHVRIHVEQPTVKKSEFPLVEFSYPTKDGWYNIRSIRMIACNQEYIIGLDVHDKFQFKRFSRSKIINGIRVMEFNSSVIK